jgi:hypothetical protein
LLNYGSNPARRKNTDKKLSEVATTAINVDLAETKYNTFKILK